MRFKMFPPKENSKRQQKLKENPPKYKVVACNRCHRTDCTLMKGKDSYYCKECFNELYKNNKKEN